MFLTINFRKYICLLTLISFFWSQKTEANLNFIKDNTFYQSKLSTKGVDSLKISNEWKQFSSKFSNWDTEIKLESSNFKINYSFNDQLESYIKSQLLLYRPDYTSIVVIDNSNGEIIAAVDYARAKNEFSRELSFSNSHPAASVFKVITAADLLENTHIKTSTEFQYTGRSTTLYKYQLKEPASRRYVRAIDLEKAFATSNNVIFGRTAIENLTPAGLKKMAEKFGFNQSLLTDIDLPPSIFEMAQDQYNLAELSSGLNRQTNMSPVHGAVIASIVANGGVLKFPFVIKSIDSLESDKKVFPPQKPDQVVLTKEAAEDLRTLFLATVKKGTARTSFRRSKYLLDKFEIGGKTGSLTGGIPFGKRDWFVSYAKMADDKNDKGISVCVMIVNQKKWYVKSPYLTKNIMDYYYKNIYSKK